MITTSNRRQKALKVIYETIDKHGFPPTVREIGEAIGVASTATVYSFLRDLERDGYITRMPRRSRAITITARGLELIGVGDKSSTY